MGSRSKDSGTVVQQTNTAPWAAQQPYLQKAFSAAEQNILNRPMQYFPNSTFVPMSGQTGQALNMAEQRAMGGSPLEQMAQNQTMATARGDFLNNNPYLQGAIETASRPIVDNFQTSVAPSIAAQFSRAGRYGSGQQERAMTQAAQNMQQQLADLSGSMSYRNYGDERGRQMQAISALPGMAQIDWQNIGKLQGVGAVREGFAEDELQDQINRFNFNQGEAGERAARYMAAVGGGSFGSQSNSVQPVTRNRFAGMLGGGLSGAQAGSGFGPWGAGIGALAGGLLGGM